MIYLLKRKGFKFLHPILRRLATYYLSKTRTYKSRGISIKIAPGVFHPGLFYSTNCLLEYLDHQKIKNNVLLELGAGSGLISIYCAKKGAIVTATDINTNALHTLKENAKENNVYLEILHSDLFDNLPNRSFDLIVINPPYYPKDPNSEVESAWFCGSKFEYFRKLFKQIPEYRDAKILMVLSEDCDIKTITKIAEENNIGLELQATKQFNLEKNFIYQLK